MPDLGLFGDIAKIVGGGVVGGLGTLLRQRNKRRRLRRGLYREMLHNYFLVRGFINSAKKMRGLNAPLRGVTVRVDLIATDYYEYAKKDMDAFAELPESMAVSSFYRTLDALVQIVPSGANAAVPIFNTACQLAHTMEETFVDEGYSMRLAKKVLDARSIRAFEGLIENMRANGIAVDEHPLPAGPVSTARF